MKIEVNIERRHVFVLVAVLLVGFGAVCVTAYNEGNPTSVGHAWGDIGNIPTAFQDGRITWTEVYNRPWGLDDFYVNWDDIQGNCPCGSCWDVVNSPNVVSCGDDPATNPSGGTHLCRYLCTPEGWRLTFSL